MMGGGRRGGGGVKREGKRGKRLPEGFVVLVVV